MFSGFGMKYLKQKLSMGKTSSQTENKSALRTIDITLTSDSKSSESKPAATPTNYFSNGLAKPMAPKESSTARVVTAEDIAKRAHEVWTTEGCQQGKDLEYWLRAEKELNGLN